MRIPPSEDITIAEAQLVSWCGIIRKSRRRLLNAPIISAEKDYHEHVSATNIATSVSEPDLSLVKCEPRQGKCMACFLGHRDDVVPKNRVSFAPLQECVETRCQVAGQTGQLLAWSVRA